MLRDISIQVDDVTNTEIKPALVDSFIVANVQKEFKPEFVKPKVEIGFEIVQEEVKINLNEGLFQIAD